MPLEFPAVSQSRVSLWGQPQYTQKGMLLFTILFGFWGLHHFYLRSPQTGLLILLANIFTLGYPYFFDIIQLATKPFDELQSKGLDLPWSVAGIAQGMWINPNDQAAKEPNTPLIKEVKRFVSSFTKEDTPLTAAQAQTGGGDEDVPTGPPAPHWFLLYSLLLPLAPLARYIAGDSNNALLGLLNLTIIPLGFLFYGVSIVSEYWTLFMKPKELLTDGIYRTFPFTKFGYSETGYSPRLTGHVAEEPLCEDEFILIRIFKGIYRSVLPPWLVALIDQAVATKTQVVDRAIDTAQKVKEKVDIAVETGSKVAKLATEIPGAIQNAQGQLQQAVKNATEKAPLPPIQSVERITNAQQQAAAAVQQVSQNNTSKPQAQTGGGFTDTLTQTDKFVAGGLLAVILSGFVIHTGRSAWNAIQDVRSATDLPPHASFYA